MELKGEILHLWGNELPFFWLWTSYSTDWTICSCAVMRTELKSSCQKTWLCWKSHHWKPPVGHLLSTCISALSLNAQKICWKIFRQFKIIPFNECFSWENEKSYRHYYINMVDISLLYTSDQEMMQKKFSVEMHIVTIQKLSNFQGRLDWTHNTKNAHLLIQHLIHAKQQARAAVPCGSHCASAAKPGRFGGRIVMMVYTMMHW
jgi:hypothetical protein